VECEKGVGSSFFFTLAVTQNQEEKESRNTEISPDEKYSNAWNGR
jgi:hypothetical protein